MDRVPTCTQAEFEAARAATEKFSPAIIPPGWTPLRFPKDHPLEGVKAYHNRDGMTVFLTASVWPGDPSPDRIWLHVSLSRLTRMPDYADMCEVKRLFIGPKRKALQIFPEESQHVNIHPHCLHLWCCVEGETDLPDFGKFGTI